MEISKEELLECTSNEIYQKLSEFFNNLYDVNKHLDLSFLNYKAVVLEEIELSKEEYTGEIPYNVFIKKRILERLEAEEDMQKRYIISEYLKSFGNAPLYNVELEEDELIEKAKNGNIEARNKIVENYLKLVIFVAKRYANKGLPFDDIIQEGNLGLIKAIEKYDKTKGSRFSSYAVWWIGQSILRAIDNKANLIRIPVYINEKLFAYKRTYAKLEKEYVRKPTSEEIAKELKLSLKTIHFIESINRNLTSLNESVSEDRTAELEDIIAEEDIPVDDKIITKSLVTEVDDLLENCKLNERELEIIKARYGFYDNKLYTYEELSQIYGVSGERIRQQEKKALASIRNSKNVYNFINYMDSPKKAFEFLKLVNSNSYSGRKNIIKKRNEELIYNEATGDVDRITVKTIYEIFSKFKKSDVNNAISKLDFNDQFFLFFRYGGSLENIVLHDLTSSQKKYFNEVLIPKIYKELTTNSDNKKVYNAQTLLVDNYLTVNDYMRLRSIFDKISSYDYNESLSVNEQVIALLRNGYVNNIQLTKEDILSLIHISSLEYDEYIEKEYENTLKKTKSKR